MLLARYFLLVGGVLLALLFFADAVAPKLPAAATDRNDRDTDKAVIRIHSDRKWPERVVFDTRRRSPTSRQRPACERPLRGSRRLSQKKPEAKLQRKRKIARSRVAPPMIQVAQQPRFGFFNTW